MNCKQAEELLPLYAGRDLSEKHARSVIEHMQTCAACARVVDQYGEASRLTQQFTPPVINDDVYAGIRLRELREIANEPTAPGVPQVLVSWVRPRKSWAVATAVAVGFG
ncbi:MAG: zf-HC2 domain-containing protein, partial [Pyrinomonadaceae bacterium]